MHCPNCQIKLKPVKIKGINPGYFINLDQCSKCGGIWFDTYEFYQISANEARGIDQADKNLLDKRVPIHNNLSCPRDHIMLNKVKDNAIAKDVQIFRCLKCNGVWLNKGELAEFSQGIKSKKIIKKIEISYERKSYDEIKKELEKKMGKSEYTNTLARMGAYFRGPITDTGQNFNLPDKDIEEQSVLSPEEKEQIAMAPPRQRNELYKNFIAYRQGDIGYKAKKITKDILSSIISVFKFIFNENREV